MVGREWSSENGIRVHVLAATPDPERVVWQAAHQCYSAGFAADDEVPGSYGTAIVERLLKRGHFGPFEHPQITLNIGGVSRALMAQLTRHRVGMSFDVQSLRYTNVEEAYPERDFVYPPYLASDGKTRERFKGTVQVTYPDVATNGFRNAYGYALRKYRSLISQGVPAEDARMVLPIGLKINLTMSCNARSAMHLLDMRGNPAAQWEINELCRVLLDVFKEWAPHTFTWYEQNRMGRHRLAP